MAWHVSRSGHRRHVVAPFVATLVPEDPIVDVLATDEVSSADALARGADLAIGIARPGAPFQSTPLAVLPVWAYVPLGHPWARREAAQLAELKDEPLIGPPPTSTARQALDTSLAANGATSASFTEATNGTVAQALTAAGRGIAVVSDDPRYGLVPIPVGLPGGGVLSIRLVSTWDPRHAAPSTLRTMAGRMSRFVTERYNVPAS